MRKDRLRPKSAAGAVFSLAWILTLALLCAGSMAQAQTAQKATKVPLVAATPAPVASVDENSAATRDELLRLLVMTPRLTTVIAYDPSLLGDEAYIDRNNPELERFLREHPAVVRNPEFYLFANLSENAKRNREIVLHRAPWPEAAMPESSVRRDLIPFLVFALILGAVFWLIRRLLENGRWSRMVKLQTEINNKLMDRFSSNEQLLAYMNTDAGKRLLESTSIPLSLDSRATVGNPLARVLTPLQFGVVLTLVGIGFIFLRHNIPDAENPFLVFGTLGLMLGIGFIICAGLSLALARHLGLLPKKAEAENEGGVNPVAKSQF